jgi:hypothetical protein
MVGGTGRFSSPCLGSPETLTTHWSLGSPETLTTHWSLWRSFGSGEGFGCGRQLGRAWHLPGAAGTVGEERRLTTSLPQAVVGGLLSPEEDHSLLISQFCQYMEYDDIRYHTMQAATSTTARITKQQTEVSDRVPLSSCVTALHGGRWVVGSG